MCLHVRTNTSYIADYRKAGKGRRPEEGYSTRGYEDDGGGEPAKSQDKPLDPAKLQEKSRGLS